MANTGEKAYSTLEEYFIDDGTPTGVTKPNVSSDPDYVAPVTDTTMCPIPNPNDYTLVTLMQNNVDPASAYEACQVSIAQGDFYHDGVGTYPGLNDVIYEGPNIGAAAMSMQGDRWHKVQGSDLVILIEDPSATVIGVNDCTEVIELSTDRILFASGPESANITLKSVPGWNLVTVLPAWLTVTPSSGVGGVHSITLDSTSNSGGARDITLEFNNGQRSAYILVEQDAGSGGGGTTTS